MSVCLECLRLQAGSTLRLSPSRWRQAQRQLTTDSPSSASLSKANTSRTSAHSAVKPGLLPRPVGVSEQHNEQSKSPEQRNIAKRKVIVKELQKSYFQDFKDIQVNKGKLWIAPETAIRADRALMFPEMRGKPISRTHAETSTSALLPGKVSVVAIEGTRLSMDHVNSFVNSVEGDHTGNPNFQLVRINLQENYLKSLIVNMFVSNLRRVVPRDQHEKYLVSSQNMEMLREPMGMLNKSCGYVYLVDWKSRVRWAAVGFAEPQEVLNLRTVATVLLERLKDGKEG